MILVITRDCTFCRVCLRALYLCGSFQVCASSYSTVLGYHATFDLPLQQNRGRVMIPALGSGVYEQLGRWNGLFIFSPGR